ncbi:hypothetical protein VTL71DRAFT_12364 [Oculimacula yallundae]|uniref:Uncharacterized protein n=1 Tax=Oculimacula yallundae TaxID=86028 RepID=A0ABR4CMV2_9HELO
MEGPIGDSELQFSDSWGRRTSQALMSQLDKLQQTDTPVQNIQSITRPNFTLNLPPQPVLTTPQYKSPYAGLRSTEKPSSPQPLQRDTRPGQVFAPSSTTAGPTASPMTPPGAVIAKKQRPVYRTMPYGPRPGTASRSESSTTLAKTSSPGSISSPAIIATPSSIARNNDRPLPPLRTSDENVPTPGAGKSQLAKPAWPLLRRLSAGCMKKPPVSAPPTTPLPTLPSKSPPMRRDYSQPHWHPSVKIGPPSPDDYFSLVRVETSDINSVPSSQNDTPSTIRPQTRRKSHSISYSSYSIPNTPIATPGQHKYQYHARSATADSAHPIIIKETDNSTSKRSDQDQTQVQGQVRRPRVSRGDSMPLPLFLYGSVQDGTMDFHVQIPDEKKAASREASRVRERQSEKRYPLSPPAKSVSFEVIQPPPLKVNKNKALPAVEVLPIGYAEYQDIRRAYNAESRAQSPAINNDESVSVTVGMSVSAPSPRGRSTTPRISSPVSLPPRDPSPRIPPPGISPPRNPVIENPPSNASAPLEKTSSWFSRAGTWMLEGGSTEGEGGEPRTGAQRDKRLLFGIVMLVLLSFVAGLLAGLVIGFESR